MYGITRQLPSWVSEQPQGRQGLAPRLLERPSGWHCHWAPPAHNANRKSWLEGKQGLLERKAELLRMRKELLEKKEELIERKEEWDVPADLVTCASSCTGQQRKTITT